MRSLLFTITSLLLYSFCFGQEQYASVGADNREIEQPMFYYNTLILIQKQDFTEQSLKEKLKGKWQNIENRKWEFMFWMDDKNLRLVGVGSGTGDTVSGGYSILGMTDTLKSWDNYKGTGFYLVDIDERVIESNYKYPINELMDHQGLKVRDYHFPTEYIIDNQIMTGVGDASGYKILEIYDNTLILSSFDDVYVFSRVQKIK